MEHMISSSSSSTPSHAVLNSTTTRLHQSLRRQQDCHLHLRCDAASGYGYGIKQPQAPEYVVSSSVNGIPVPPVGYPQATPRVELPSDIDAEHGKAWSIASPLDQALTSVPGYQDTAWISQHSQGNSPVSTSLTSYAGEDGGSFIINQLWHGYNEGQYRNADQGSTRSTAPPSGHCSNYSSPHSLPQ
ncbi:hypothetical protein EDC04DRAFT_1241839 [Pisolithus marmoratus]|nr:hypothetical protein EDC04DRAFT_1241839 [Pisolithus marmoratus]